MIKNSELSQSAIVILSVKKFVPKSRLEELCALLNAEVILYTQAIKEHKDFQEVKKISQRIKHLQYLIDVAAQEILS